jgi:hypothetical protein
MISVTDEAICSQRDFRCPFDRRFSDVLESGSGLGSLHGDSLIRDAGSDLDLAMVQNQGAEMISCEGNFRSINS